MLGQAATAGIDTCLPLLLPAICFLETTPMTHLNPPVGAHDHAQGPENAPVTLTEYGDFQCPDCGDAYPVVQQMQQMFGERLRFVFRNFPLNDIHPYAEHAAEAAEAAGAQGKFWPMHDTLFTHQRALHDPQLAQYAQQAGADPAAVTQALADGTFAKRVGEDLQSGERSGVQGTPTFYINGIRFDGDWTSDEFPAALRAAGAR